MVRKYDKDGDGELKGEELSGLKEVSQAGTLKGLDAFVARFLVMQFGRAGSGEEDENGDWSQFDRDNDGLASADELAVMRHQKQKP
jgi:Ca2+-binding EF-hand superfamily protein